MSDENDENILVEAIESLEREISNLNDSTHSLHRALGIINDQILQNLSKKIDSLESEIRSLKDVIEQLIKIIEFDIRTRFRKKNS